MSEHLPAVPQQQTSLMPSMQEWTIIKEQATLLVRSGFLPKGIDTPEKAIAVALKGREMGIPMMQAYSHIAIVNGKPCVSAELMLAQIRKNVPGAKVVFEERTNELCRLKTKRPGEDWQVFSFSHDDAKKAGLLDKPGPWKQYPRAMLHARCVSEMARSVYPDAIMGCSYTPEEMGAEVDGDGEIIEVKPQHEVISVKATPPEHPQKAPDTTFNFNSETDREWIKAHPALMLMDTVEKKKVALELHGKDRSELEKAIRRVEDAHVRSAQNVVDATPAQ